MTIDELSAKTGISKRMISAYEANENEISLAKVQIIAKALEVPMYKLISGDHSDIEIESEKQFEEWKSKVYEDVTINDKEFQKKYIDVLEQLVETQKEIQRLKDELGRK